MPSTPEQITYPANKTQKNRRPPFASSGKAPAPPSAKTRSGLYDATRAEKLDCADNGDDDKV